MTDPRYPRGKIHPEDQGETGLRIFIDGRTQTVVLDFMKPVCWLGFSARDVRNVARMLVQAADHIEHGTPWPPEPPAPKADDGKDPH